MHSVAWQPRRAAEAGAVAQRRPCLLSASMDRTMALWRPEAGGAPRTRCYEVLLTVSAKTGFTAWPGSPAALLTHAQSQIRAAAC